MNAQIVDRPSQGLMMQLTGLPHAPQLNEVVIRFHGGEDGWCHELTWDRQFTIQDQIEVQTCLGNLKCATQDWWLHEMLDDMHYRVEEQEMHERKTPPTNPLVQVQLEIWPDSNLDHEHELPLHWVFEDEKVTDRDKAEVDARWLRILDGGDGKPNLLKQEEWMYRQLLLAEYRVRALERALGTAKSCLNAYSGEKPQGLLFYECDMQPDGTYSFRGARYGTEPGDYFSGFSRH